MLLDLFGIALGLCTAHCSTPHQDAPSLPPRNGIFSPHRNSRWPDVSPLAPSEAFVDLNHCLEHANRGLLEGVDHMEEEEPPQRPYDSDRPLLVASTCFSSS